MNSGIAKPGGLGNIGRNQRIMQSRASGKIAPAGRERIIAKAVLAGARGVGASPPPPTKLDSAPHLARLFYSVSPRWKSWTRLSDFHFIYLNLYASSLFLLL